MNLTCPKCGSTKTRKKAIRLGKRRIYCNNCKKGSTVPIDINIETSFKNTRIPKILLLDIETLPMHVRVWGLYKQRIPIQNILEDWIMVCWSAKWLMSVDTMSDTITSTEAINRDDKRITESIWKLIDSADIIIAHNLKRFDIRKLNARFIINGLIPPSPYQMLDTLEQSRRNFAFSSHKLDFLGQLIRNEGKIKTDYQLWIDCENGISRALKEMSIYCDEDVNLLEEAYLWIRPWIKSHPNVGLYMDLSKPVCSNCGGDKFDYDGDYTTSANRYSAIRCKSCNAIGRVAVGKLSTDQRRTLNRPIAR